jgi:hypothetical protein
MTRGRRSRMRRRRKRAGRQRRKTVGYGGE